MIEQIKATEENGITTTIFPDYTSISVPKGQAYLLNDTIKGKNFILWHFHISHCQMIMRHTEYLGEDILNTDLYFYDVEYISLPTNIVGMGELQFGKTTKADEQKVAEMLRLEVPSNHIYTLLADDRKYYVAAAGMNLITHKGNGTFPPYVNIEPE